jgi:hypothetical protein
VRVPVLSKAATVTWRNFSRDEQLAREVGVRVAPADTSHYMLTRDRVAVSVASSMGLGEFDQLVLGIGVKDRAAVRVLASQAECHVPGSFVVDLDSS